jgi:NodT family efflux transporter outer membrane factor (OMF) lipoprotein
MKHSLFFHRLPPLVLATVLGAGSAPAMGPRPLESASGPLPTAETWQSTGTPGQVQDGWLATFGDPELVEFVIEAQAHNPDLAAAAGRLLQASAAARQAGSLLYPELGLNAGAAKRIQLGGQTPQQLLQGVGSESNTLGVSLDLSWELDIWGKLRSGKRGQQALAQASVQDYRAARESLAGQVAKGRFQATLAKLQLDLNNEFVTNYTETLRVVQARFDAGSVSEQDLANARGDLATAQQSARSAATAYNDALRSLEILLGRYPAADLAAAQDLQATPPPVPAGLPSELLERRPDVLAAERRVAGAYQFSRQAQAARLPALALTSGVGGSSKALAELVDPRYVAANFAANLFQPLFDAGLRKARYDQARGVEAEALEIYRATALRAFQEVENILDSETSLAEQEDRLRAASGSYERARKIAEIRYKEGASDLTDVLVVQRQELQSKTTLLNVRASRLSQRVNLHLALGGNFQTPPPAIHVTQP